MRSSSSAKKKLPLDDDYSNYELVIPSPAKTHSFNYENSNKLSITKMY